MSGVRESEGSVDESMRQTKVVQNQKVILESSMELKPQLAPEKYAYYNNRRESQNF